MIAALLAIASGTALALALPGPGLWPLVFLFPGLLLEAIRRSRGWRGAAFLGLLAGTAHWCVATNWVVPVMHHYGGLPLAMAIACLAAMALLLGLTWAIVAALARSATPALLPWTFTFAWAAVEAVRQTVPYRFPWNPVAAAATFDPRPLASLPVWGATGLGWALVAAGAAVWALGHRATRRSGFVLAVATAAAVAACTALAPPARPVGGPVRVAVLQPGTTLEEKWNPANAEQVAGRVVDLTRRAAQERAEIVLWPESAAPYSLERDAGYRATVTRLARDLDITIVLNSIGSLPGGGYTNSAYEVGPGGPGARRYDKVRLVPFGEYVPWIGRFAFARALVREVGRFTPGHDLRPLPAGPFRAGMAICYEIVFADLTAAEVRGGADVLFTVTNDGWYGYSWAPSQHFGQAILRAVESRRWVVRAALTGISGFVDPDGRVVERLPVGESGVLVHEVAPMTGLTLRARYGDWWGVFCGLALLPLLAVSRRRRPLRARRSG